METRQQRRNNFKSSQPTKLRLASKTAKPGDPHNRPRLAQQDHKGARHCDKDQLSTKPPTTKLPRVIPVSEKENASNAALKKRLQKEKKPLQQVDQNQPRQTQVVAAAGKDCTTSRSRTFVACVRETKASKEGNSKLKPHGCHDAQSATAHQKPAALVATGKMLTTTRSCTDLQGLFPDNVMCLSSLPSPTYSSHDQVNPQQCTEYIQVKH